MWDIAQCNKNLLVRKFPYLYLYVKYCNPYLFMAISTACAFTTTADMSARNTIPADAWGLTTQ